MPRGPDIRAACGQAIDWIETNRRDSARLDRESGSLMTRLRRARNRTRSLARAAERRFAIGFFGLSQAGKSYLISAFAANAEGRLDLAVGPERLSFITHINPPGGGKEATGLVTRLTRHPASSSAELPVRLQIFSQADLIKVLGNAFFNDFDRERAPLDLDAAKIRAHLTRLESHRRSSPLPGLDADDVVDLQDYFEKRFPRSTQSLRSDFWPSAGALAPRLDDEGRADLFALLWGEIPELTATFKLLCEALGRIDHATTLDCEIAALVQGNAEGDWTPKASLVDVKILERLGRDMDDTLKVRPVRDTAAVETISIPRSVLAALTAEIALTLADAPRVDLLEQVDILDFPGYRGRLSIGDLQDVRRELHDDQIDPVAELFLRGKVAYLFERYTEDLEMGALVLCAPSNQQSDVNDLGPVIESWVHATQGREPAARTERRTGLFWALTKFDQRLDVVPGQTPELMKNGWEGMIKLALLERFGRYEWVREWAPGRCFDNLFLVRKPGLAGAVIRTDGERELEVLTGKAPQLTTLRKTFCEHELIRKYVRDPAEAWDAMLSLNDGGLSRLAEHLAHTVDIAARQTDIAERIETLANDIVGLLHGYYQARGAEAAADKQRLAAKVVRALGARPIHCGDLLDLLQPSREDLRGLYLRSSAENDRLPDGDPAAAPKGWSPIDLGDIIESPITDDAGKAGSFARDAVRAWVTQLRELVEDRDILTSLELTGEAGGVLDILVKELIIGADRLGLERSITPALDENERIAGIKREQLAARQVALVHGAICDFVDGLETFAPGEDGKSAGLAALFPVPPAIPPGELPTLPPEPEPFTNAFIGDWLRAFVALAINNAGYTTGQDITPEQNRRLGRILDALKGQLASGAAPSPV
ncbi:virulence factor SrfC family protein [Thiocapsa marina]|uniref:Virulence effector protein SrfC n=1 Tax=Thiocapsa marina 5811 TaxID=768671 RepID=F9UIR8_9GAMM|nr:virulence factor SrfC family protein [Thiocapsa marina]EGV15899.1 Virulence effector protein SrfC [Thiocapsa marina 5811]